ncbi:ATP-binding protein [Chromobacterium aquaticum]|uniref:ATP-binding protein n=1 Tax=Chromobacterium aquaticum TaxID=467180 RepID=UPI001E627597|nr:ATP-binding protein [Chromobacterium aquaticum]MCD5360576.1 CHASE domain-containing protein [Chromobacterium aquaticum]
MRLGRRVIRRRVSVTSVQAFIDFPFDFQVIACHSLYLWPELRLIAQQKLLVMNRIPASRLGIKAEILRKFRRDGVHLFVLAWVLSALLVAVLWGIGELQRLRDEFESVAQRAHALVARKLDQNESVLASVDALMVASRPFEAAALGTFARELLPHYPQLHSFVFFQSVSMSERQAFLHQMSGKFGETFYIRDFDVAGRREWRPAAVRPQSLVISMLEPDRPEAGPMFGYDILGDDYFRPALLRALESGRRVSSGAFELHEGGGRAYLLLQPLFEQEARTQGRLIGVVGLVVFCDRLLQAPALERLLPGLDLALYQGGEASGGPPLFQRLHTSSERDWWPVLRRLEARLPLASEAQPFVLGVARDLRVTDLAILPLLWQQSLLLAFFVFAGLLHLQRMALRQERLQSDEAIFLQSERASVTLSAIHDGVIILRQDHAIELANPMALELMGMDAGEVVGRVCHEVFHLQAELAAEFAEDPIRECFRTAQPVVLAERMQLTSARGQIRSVEGGVSPLFSRDGSLIGVVCALRDLGPLRLRTVAALEASESKVKEHLEKLSHVARLHTMGEMASGIAHELNQPLTAIANYCQASIQLLEGVEDAPAQVNAALRLAVAQAERAGEIIKRLRALVSKRAIETRLIDLNQVVGNCMFLAEYDLKERGIEVVQLLSGYPVAVFADSIQLEQVVLNLLSNAMDALRDEPVMKRHVIVHTRREGKKAILEVRDTGRGITPSSLEVLFHPFFSTKPNGMGLGLSICQTIVEQYGGLISAENIPASGACFRIELPLSRQGEPARPVMPSPDGCGAGVL